MLPPHHREHTSESTQVVPRRNIHVRRLPSVPFACPVIRPRPNGVTVYVDVADPLADTTISDHGPHPSRTQLCRNDWSGDLTAAGGGPDQSGSSSDRHPSVHHTHR